MLLLNQKMTESKAWEKGLVMELFKSDNFSEQVDNRVTVMSGLSNKLNTLFICHMESNQCSDDPAFIFRYF